MDYGVDDDFIHSFIQSNKQSINSSRNYTLLMLPFFASRSSVVVRRFDVSVIKLTTTHSSRTKMVVLTTTMMMVLVVGAIGITCSLANQHEYNQLNRNFPSKRMTLGAFVLSPSSYNNYNHNKRRRRRNWKLGNLHATTPPNDKEEKKDEYEKDGGTKHKHNHYKSRSTSSPDASSNFHAGSEERKQRLHEALAKIGLNNPEEELLNLPEYKGSAALRTYSSFVLPKSEGALAMTNQPQRAAVVANSIVFLMREHRSHQEEWLRNHDRSLEEVAAAAAANSQSYSKRNPIVLVLDGIRSAHNVGNILRASEAAFCQEVLLCGSMTPSPPHPKVLKTALGAAEYVPYRTVGSTLEAVQELQQKGIKVIGVETTSRSVPLWKLSFFETTSSNKDGGGDDDDGDQQQIEEPQPVAFVFGNELVGVDTTVLEECDALVAVPTHGIKNSLNVATCASVIIWEALRQWESIKGDTTT